MWSLTTALFRVRYYWDQHRFDGFCQIANCNIIMAFCRFFKKKVRAISGSSFASKSTGCTLFSLKQGWWDLGSPLWFTSHCSQAWLTFPNLGIMVENAIQSAWISAINSGLIWFFFYYPHLHLLHLWSLIKDTIDSKLTGWVQDKRQRRLTRSRNLFQSAWPRDTSFSSIPSNQKSTSDMVGTRSFLSLLSCWIFDKTVRILFEDKDQASIKPLPSLCSWCHRRPGIWWHAKSVDRLLY